MKNYPELYHNLVSLLKDLKVELKEPTQAFSILHKSAINEGVLSQKIKELMALGIAIANNCHECIAFHTHDALKAGATKEEVLETIGVAIMMGGGPALMYGCEAYSALIQFYDDSDEFKDSLYS